MSTKVLIEKRQVAGDPHILNGHPWHYMTCRGLRSLVCIHRGFIEVFPEPGEYIVLSKTEMDNLKRSVLYATEFDPTSGAYSRVESEFEAYKLASNCK